MINDIVAILLGICVGMTIYCFRVQRCGPPPNPCLRFRKNCHECIDAPVVRVRKRK